MENEIIPSDSCFCFSCWPKRRNCISWWCIIMMSRLAGQNRKLIFSKLHLLWPQYVLKTSHAPNIDSYHSTSSLNQHHLLFLLQISFLFLLLLLLDVFKFKLLGLWWQFNLWTRVSAIVAPLLPSSFVFVFVLLLFS